MRKWMAGLLVCVLWLEGNLPARATPTSCDVKFSDLTAAHPACAAIAELAERGIIIGYPDGSFRPDRAVTRAEMAALLVRLLGAFPLPDAPAGFADVPPGHWAARHGLIQAALAMGVMTGEPGPEGTVLFHPDAPVTAAEAVSLVAAAVGLPTRPISRDATATRAEVALLLQSVPVEAIADR